MNQKNYQVLQKFMHDMRKLGVVYPADRFLDDNVPEKGVVSLPNTGVVPGLVMAFAQVANDISFVEVASEILTLSWHHTLGLDGGMRLVRNENWIDLDFNDPKFHHKCTPDNMLRMVAAFQTAKHLGDRPTSLKRMGEAVEAVLRERYNAPGMDAA